MNQKKLKIKSRKNQESDQTLQQLVKGSGVIFVGQIITFIVAFLYQIIIARYLGSELFGVFSLCLVIMSVGTIVVKLGIPQGVSRFVSFYSAQKKEKQVKGVISASLVIFLISSIIVVFVFFIFSGLLSDIFFHSREHILILKIFIIAIPFAAVITFFYELFLGFKKPLFSVIIEAGAHKLLRLFATIAILFFSGSLLNIGLTYLVGLIIATFVGFILLEKLLPIFTSKLKSIKNYKELMQFSFPLFLTALLALVFGWVDSLMIGFFMNTTQVGIYRIAFSLSAFMNIFVLSFGAILYPVMSGFLAKKNLAMIRKSYKTISRIIFMISLPVIFIALFFSKQIISILYGAEFVSGSLALSILVIGYLFTIILGPFDKIIQVFSHTKFIFKVQLIGVVINIFFNILLIPFLGILGAAITTTGTLIFIALVSIFKVKKLSGVTFDKMPYVKYCISGLISVGIVYLLVYFISIKSILFFIALAVVFFVLYFVLLILFKSFDKDDIMLIRATENKLGFKTGFISKLIKIDN